MNANHNYLALMVESQVSTIAQLEQQLREVTAENAKLKALQEVDQLTGLLNRWAFQNKLSAHISRCRNAEKFGESYLAFLDIDNFSDYNEKHGHQKGDIALRRAGQVLRHSMRQNDIAVRQGGDEFVVLLQRVESESHAAMFIMRILDFIRSETDVTMSAGYTLIKPEDTAVSALHRADVSMYGAKANGRNQARAA